jgi:hypothetical protein
VSCFSTVNLIKLIEVDVFLEANLEEYKGEFDWDELVNM